jgi:DNA-binding MarR family transcriptional regulator
MQHLEADLTILDQIELEPDTTQASMAKRLDVAVGTINWHMQRLIQKGYVKVKRAERRKLRYIITPEGIALRARLMVDYVQSSLKLYRLVRQRSLRAIETLKQRGITRVCLEGEGDVAEIYRLTCLEQGIHISNEQDCNSVKVVGLKIFIDEENG